MTGPEARHNLGFTLIEVLYATFFSVFAAADASEDVLEGRLTAARLVDAVTGEVRSAAFIPNDPRFVFTGTLDGPVSRLTLSAYRVPPAGASAGNRAPASDLVIVTYGAERGEGGTGLDVYREVTDPYTGESVRVEAAEGVDGFRVEYLGPRGWAGAWDAGLEGRLPPAVRVTASPSSMATGSATRAR